MVNKNFRPSERYFLFLCPYEYISWFFRRKATYINWLMICINGDSKGDYRLLVDRDCCSLLDVLANRILWKADFSSSMVALINLLHEVLKFYEYESDYNKIKNYVDSNHYQRLKKIYHVRQN